MTDLDYAKVIGRFGLTVGDTGTDPDDDPDTVWCTEGRVIITPLNTFVKVASGSPVPWTGGNAQIECAIDGNGYLTYTPPGGTTKQFVEVVDLTSSKVNPQITTGATHRVTFADVKSGTTPVAFPTFTCRLTAAGDGVSGAGINDLTIVAPIVPGEALPITRGPQGVSIESLAVNGLGELEVQLDDGTTVNAGDLPVGPGGSDAGVAGYLSTPASASRAALDDATADLLDDPTSAVAIKTSASIAGEVLGSGTTTSEGLNAAYEARLTNNAVVFGTSLELLNGTGTTTLDPGTDQSLAVNSRGWFIWANAYLGQRFSLVHNAGVGGNTYADMLARIQADVMAYDFDVCFMGGPVNDVANDRTAAAIIADATSMLDILGNAGKRVVLLTAAPSTSYSTAGRKQVLGAVNAWIRALPLTRRNVIVVDAWRALADPSTGSPATGMAVDAVHYTEAAAHRVGKAVATAISPFFPPKPSAPSSLVDPNNVLGNPYFGTGTGWTADSAVTATYGAATDSWASRATLEIAGVTDNNEQKITYIENISGGRFAVGDVVQASARIRWSSLVPRAVTSPCRPFLRIFPREVGGTFTTPALNMFTASANNAIPAGIPASGEVVVQTHRLTIPANVDRLYIAVGWIGLTSAHVEVEDLQVYKNA